RPQDLAGPGIDESAVGPAAGPEPEVPDQPVPALEPRDREARAARLAAGPELPARGGESLAGVQLRRREGPQAADEGGVEADHSAGRVELHDGGATQDGDLAEA